MDRVLVIEDGRTFARLLVQRIGARLGIEADVAETLAAAARLLADTVDDPYVAALVDLTLPDAADVEIVDAVASYGVPTIVFTASDTPELRARILGRNVLDYVVKHEYADLHYAVDVVGRLRKNRGTKVLVVDDGAAARCHLAGLLRARRLTVLEAADGLEALAKLEQHPDVRLVVTDFDMPNLDGCGLVARIRERHAKDELAVIGLSGSAGSELPARFLKRGANDFLSKPYGTEELVCRVHQNLEQLELFAAIRALTYEDALTGLWNRRYLFERGPEVLRAADGPRAVAMLDLDFFKRVNDSRGHEAGDQTLRHVAALAREYSDATELVARVGGEELCFLGKGPADDLAMRLDGLRWAIERSPVPHVDGEPVRVTISIGVAAASDDLGESLRRADAALYRAKDEGRNRVVLDGAAEAAE